MTIFVVAASLLFFWFYLYRMLTTLDPAAAIPARTQLLMDTLVEGMAILDEGGRIVMTNQSFAETAFSSIERLMGQKLSSLRWVTQGDGGADGNTICPWDTVASRELRQRDVRMQLLIGARHARRLNVNTSPIRGTDDRFLGMAVTFADETVTAAENLNMTDFVARVSAASANVGRLCEELQAHADVAHREELGAMNSAVSEVVELCHSALQPSKVSSVAPAAPATAGSNS